MVGEKLRPATAPSWVVFILKEVLSPRLLFGPIRKKALFPHVNIEKNRCVWSPPPPIRCAPISDPTRKKRVGREESWWLQKNGVFFLLLQKGHEIQLGPVKRYKGCLGASHKRLDPFLYHALINPF